MGDSNCTRGKFGISNISFPSSKPSASPYAPGFGKQDAAKFQIARFCLVSNVASKPTCPDLSILIFIDNSQAIQQELILPPALRHVCFPAP